MGRYDCLIVDDEEVLSLSTKEYFNMFGIRTHWVPDGKSCFDFLDKNMVDLILLDINLDQSSGFEICKKLRETKDMPILFISARTSDDDILMGLNVGGDDYIQKPYSLSVLLAKVKVVLKRYGGYENSFRCKDFELDFAMERLLVKGRERKLKAMEYKLLSYLVQNRNRLISKEELFSRVWGDSITSDGTLNVHIRKLREKIERDPNNPVYIKTLWGKGYIFEVS